MKNDIPNCNTCKHRYKLVQYEYTDKGCKHTEMEGFVCSIFANEGVMVWQIGNTGKYGCEEYAEK